MRITCRAAVAQGRDRGSVSTNASIESRWLAAASTTSVPIECPTTTTSRAPSSHPFDEGRDQVTVLRHVHA